MNTGVVDTVVLSIIYMVPISIVFFTYSGWLLTKYIYRYYSSYKSIKSVWDFNNLKPLIKSDKIWNTYVNALLGKDPNLIEKEVFFGQHSRHYGKIR